MKHHTVRIIDDEFRPTAPIYIGIEWPYGRGVTTGNPPCVHDACNPVAFWSQSDRDAWADAGPGYHTQGGYRTTLSSREPVLYGWTRRSIRQAALERLAMGDD